MPGFSSENCSVAESRGVLSLRMIRPQPCSDDFRSRHIPIKFSNFRAGLDKGRAEADGRPPILAFLLDIRPLLNPPLAGPNPPGECLRPLSIR